MRQARNRLPNKKKIDKGSPNGNPRYNPTRRIHYFTSKTSRLDGHTEKTTINT